MLLFDVHKNWKLVKRKLWLQFLGNSPSLSLTHTYINSNDLSLSLTHVNTRTLSLSLSLECFCESKFLAWTLYFLTLLFFLFWNKITTHVYWSDLVSKVRKIPLFDWHFHLIYLKYSRDSFFIINVEPWKTVSPWWLIGGVCTVTMWLPVKNMFFFHDTLVEAN